MRFYNIQVDIVTGTPGKIEDFVSTGKLKLDQVRFVMHFFAMRQFEKNNETKKYKFAQILFKIYYFSTNIPLSLFVFVCCYITSFYYLLIYYTFSHVLIIVFNFLCRFDSQCLMKWYVCIFLFVWLDKKKKETLCFKTNLLAMFYCICLSQPGWLTGTKSGQVNRDFVSTMS